MKRVIDIKPLYFIEHSQMQGASQQMEPFFYQSSTMHIVVRPYDITKFINTEATPFVTSFAISWTNKCNFLKWVRIVRPYNQTHGRHVAPIGVKPKPLGTKPNARNITEINPFCIHKLWVHLSKW